MNAGRLIAGGRAVPRMLLRELASGGLTALMLALLLASGALATVAFLVERVEGALLQHAHAMVGGDLVLVSDHPLPESYRAEANAHLVQTAESALFPSMVQHKGRTRLVEIKAVSAGYPLRGELRGALDVREPDVLLAGVTPGMVWIDEGLAASLGAHAGDEIIVGAKVMRVAGVLTHEPDRALNPFAYAPRLLMSLTDLAGTGLVQPGSRIAWRLHVAGDAQAVAKFRAWLQPRLARGERLESLEDARPELRAVIERGQRFLRLSAMLTIVLSAVAVALAARRFTQTHVDGFAVLRALGVRNSQLIVLFAGVFLLAGAFAALLGGVLGLGLQAMLLEHMTTLFSASLPPPSLRPIAWGFAIVLVLLAGFAFPPLLALRNTPATWVLRREWQRPNALALVSAGLGAALFVVMAYAFAGEWRLAFPVMIGFSAVIFVFLLIAKLLLVFLANVGARLTGVMRLGCANLTRRKFGATTPFVALTLGIAVVLLLFIGQSDLLPSWRARLPEDAPNRFVINIQPHQRAELEAFFRRHALPSPELSPMVRGRLLSIAGRPVKAEDFSELRARRLVEREFNLSSRDSLPPENRLAAGRWFGSPGTEVEFSVEQGLAETLGMRLGDVLEFAVADGVVSGRITSLRKLDWDSMRVNFFVIASPGSLDGQPMSFITSFHLPRGKEAVIDALIAEFPNLTVIDVAALLAQFERMLSQAVHVTSFVFGFALLAGLVVLFVSVEMTLTERRREIAILRALGARRAQIRRALFVEFALLGAGAGLCAALAAAALAVFLAHRLFQLDYWPTPAVFWGTVLASAIGVAFLGWMLTRQSYRVPVLAGLYER
ncbi:MAG: FtsX-like permease family protein [Rhodocyclaceae bacterium]|nr:FtsX-like permease family protein [Rhodocyclaceae bacterium]